MGLDGNWGAALNTKKNTTRIPNSQRLYKVQPKTNRYTGGKKKPEGTAEGGKWGEGPGDSGVGWGQWLFGN